MPRMLTRHSAHLRPFRQPTWLNSDGSRPKSPVRCPFSRPQSSSSAADNHSGRGRRSSPHRVQSEAAGLILGAMALGELPPCIFCDNESGSNEHAWPEWLIKEIGRIINDPDARMAYVRSAGASDLMWVEEARESFGVVVTCVCHTCNQKWMKKLEDRVSIYGKPMMNGQHKTFDLRQRVELARWATKTAIVFECDTPGSPRTPRRRCIQTKLGKYPPVTTQVFLAHYSGPRLLDCWRIHVDPTRLP